MFELFFSINLPLACASKFFYLSFLWHADLFFRVEYADFLVHQILQQVKSDAALLTLEDGGPPIQNPSTAAEDARLASLISLDGILKQVKVCFFLLL